MTKLIIQIPCYNEEKVLGNTLSQLPRKLPGIDTVEWLVVDDGSDDATLDVAREHGVDHIVSLPRHQGLARAFIAGLDAAVGAGADIIVNTDADNQYRAEDIPALIAPILENRAEIVIGARPINDISGFSSLKKLLQRIGSWLVRRISNTDIPDAPSGFRAFSRDAAMRLNVFSEYTYTLETIIQAGQKNMAITSVPISVNDETRPSRLIRSIPRYLISSVITMVRIFVTYRPLRSFTMLGGLFFAAGFLLGVRYLAFFFSGDADGHVQSLILAALLMGIGVQVLVSGLIADLISVNRKLLERIDWRLQQITLPRATQDRDHSSDKQTDESGD
ncbi:MAG: glycosyltransferase family 2 protein [Gammaproteobacteria bacterium]|nr:glycosyltransferase family 2 protein [Gammaproteobacteria bacterium]MCW8839652.1 glycosyltransferase family 2 protein [Gammaproteobacteria bacterium]MCW8927242.1 glycosyltransferase family 2 protein [Gammaproteobacteria bacterium]MCW8957661.1 glycosyltransferase family 2 protein [Gammaproteobacteria bacterium]MCW8971712.1 glycosyltransferase family 2 protein [Gammaproteobacteria bacterium]